TEPLNKLFVSAASLPLVVHNNVAPRVSDNFPSLTSKMIGFYEPIPPGSKMAIFSTQARAFDEARLALQKEGLEARFLNSTAIQRDSVRFTITFIEVIARPDFF